MVPTPLALYWEERYFIRDLIDSGFDVEYWDTTGIYFKGINFTGVVERDYVRKFDSLEDIEGRLKTIDVKNTFFIFFISLQAISLGLYRLFSRHGCLMSTFAYGLMPHGAKDIPMARKILKYAGSLVNAKKLTAYFLSKAPLLCRKMGLVNDCGVVFAAGSIAASRYEKYSRIVPVNYFDYDNYLRIRDDGKRFFDGDYCVYLDGNLAFDSDCKVLKMKTIAPDKYYGALNRFFSLVEKKCGVEVVIAASPKSEYPDGFFGKRRIYKYKTNELVKDCSFAIADFSTSVAYAVLYKKPVIFYYTDEMKGLSYFEGIKNFAAILSCDIYNIDSLGDESRLEIKPIDLEKYDAYKYAYITSKESESRYTKDIVPNYLKNYPVEDAEKLHK